MTIEHLPLLDGDGNPSTLAPNSAATMTDAFVVVSGQAAIDAATGAVLADTIAEQSEIVLGMVAAVLRRAGVTPSDVLRCECYLARREDFGAFNAVYARWFPPPSPARTTIVCDFALPGMLVEVQALARR
jgi:2-iminobutanoate/2-iminopropanoate deaminase